VEFKPVNDRVVPVVDGNERPVSGNPLYIVAVYGYVRAKDNIPARAFVLLKAEW